MLSILWFLLLLLCSHANNVLQTLQNDRNWWMLDNTTNANIYYRVEGKLIFLRHAVMDSRNIHSCYEYKVYDIETQLIEKSRTFCYPAVIISGYKKCSTSALYMLMTQYSEVLRDHGKENCIFGDQGGSNVLGLFDTYPSSISEGVLLVSGCIYWDRNYLMNEVLRRPNSFYIMIYRNYADFLWSAYNYWCSFPYDKNCRYEGQWLILRKFTRSPELFHEMVEGSVAHRNVSAPEIMQDCCRRGGLLFSNLTFSLWRSVRPANSLILSSEEMDTTPNRTWARVAAALGFRRQHKKLPAFEKVKYNVNGAKGAARPTDASKVVPGLYEISGFKPMLNSSRTLLDHCWAREGCFVSEVTQHSYTACRHSSTAAAPPYEAVDEAHLNQYRATRLNETYVKGSPFVRSKVNQCHSLILSLSHSKTAHSSNTNHHNSSSRRGKGLRVLLLSTSLIRRTMAKFLSLFLMTSDLRITSAEVSEHITPHSRDLLCGVSADRDADVTIITANPNEVAFSQGGFAYSNKEVCSGITVTDNSMKFDKVIALLDDQNDFLLLAWKLFREKSDYLNHDKPEETIARFNWSSWGEGVGREVQAVLGGQTPRMGGEYVWGSSELRRGVNELLAPEQRMILRMADVRADRGSNYVTTLKKCRDFLFPSPQRHHQEVSPLESLLSQLPLPPEVAFHEGVDLLHCSSVAVAEGLGEGEREGVGAALTEAVLADEARNLAVVYASSREVCEVERLLSSRPLEAATLRRPFAGPTSWCDTSGTESESNSAAQDQFNVCTSRYRDTVRRTDEEVPAAAALIALPGPEAVSVRLLLQYATGLTTGGPLRYSEKFTKEMGEDVPLGRMGGCGVGVLVAHIAPSDLLLFPSNHTLTTANTADSLRCSSPVSIKKAIHLVSDPLLAVWRDAVTATDVTSSIDVISAETTKKKKKRAKTNSGSIVGTASQFGPSQLGPSSVVDQLMASIASLPADQVLVLSYEELVYSSLRGDFSALRRVLSFLDWSPVDQNRLHCLQHLVQRTSDLRTTLNTIRSLENEVVKDRAAFCEARRTIQEALKKDKIIVRLLFEDAHQC